MGEFEDEYSAALEGEVRETRGALLNDTSIVLGPADPICLPGTATVHEAVETMLARRQAGVAITDAAGRLTGIFTERDVLTRVVGKVFFFKQKTAYEVGGGLGPLAGLVWRIGLMGESSRHEHVVTLLSALEQIFRQQGWTKQSGAALTAALQAYATAT